MFKSWLTSRLKNELPGPEAHSTIWSYPRNSVKEGLAMVPPPRHSSVAIILHYQKNAPFELLFILRSAFGIHGGQVAFPGGKIEPNETPLQCAIRETKEEINLDLNEDHFIGMLSPVFIPPSHMIVHPHVFILKEKTETLTLTEEVDDFFWIQHSVIHPDKIITKPHYMKAFDETRPIKGIALNDEFLWGATAMMTQELMHLHKEFLLFMNQTE